MLGLNFRENILPTARRKAEIAALDNVCHFTQSTNEVADIIVSIDAFEQLEAQLNLTEEVREAGSGKPV